MEKWIVVVALLLPVAVSADEWRSEDTYRELAFQTLWLADYRQTREIATNPSYYETNEILGRDPTLSEVDRYFAIGAAVHAVISSTLPRRYRSWWQYATIAVQAGYVGHNMSIGLSVDF